MPSFVHELQATVALMCLSAVQTTKTENTISSISSPGWGEDENDALLQSCRSCTVLRSSLESSPFSSGGFVWVTELVNGLVQSSCVPGGCANNPRFPPQATPVFTYRTQPTELEPLLCFERCAEPLAASGSTAGDGSVSATGPNNGPRPPLLRAPREAPADTQGQTTCPSDAHDRTSCTAWTGMSVPIWNQGAELICEWDSHQTEHGGQTVLDFWCVCNFTPPGCSNPFAAPTTAPAKVTTTANVCSVGTLTSTYTITTATATATATTLEPTPGKGNARASLQFEVLTGAKIAAVAILATALLVGVRMHKRRKLSRDGHESILSTDGDDSDGDGDDDDELIALHFIGSGAGQASRTTRPISSGCSSDPSNDDAIDSSTQGSNSSSPSSSDWTYFRPRLTELPQLPSIMQADKFTEFRPPEIKHGSTAYDGVFSLLDARLDTAQQFPPASFAETDLDLNTTANDSLDDQQHVHPIPNFFGGRVFDAGIPTLHHCVAHEVAVDADIVPHAEFTDTAVPTRVNEAAPAPRKLGKGADSSEESVVRNATGDYAHLRQDPTGLQQTPSIMQAGVVTDFWNPEIKHGSTFDDGVSSFLDARLDTALQFPPASFFETDLDLNITANDSLDDQQHVHAVSDALDNIIGADPLDTATSSGTTTATTTASVTVSTLNDLREHGQNDVVYKDDHDSWEASVLELGAADRNRFCEKHNLSDLATSNLKKAGVVTGFRIRYHYALRLIK
eukprot:gene8790-26280_t